MYFFLDLIFLLIFQNHLKYNIIMTNIFKHFVKFLSYLIFRLFATNNNGFFIFSRSKDLHFQNIKKMN